MSDVFVHSVSLMGTVVTIEVIGHGEDDRRRAERADAVGRAIAWFQHVEQCCSRFDPASELRRACEHVGVAAPVGATTLEAVRFALALAEATDGAFDPTVGHAMVERGFDRHYRTGEAVAVATAADGGYRDVEVDDAASTITLHRPLQLDLGAVAKGLAVDMAVLELAPLANFAVNAGGDVYVAGHNASGVEWSVGIRHPRDEHALIETLSLSNTAVCTSGDYERRSPRDQHAHHILDPRSGISANAVASATVVAPLAMVADGLATAAFVLGPERGLELAMRNGAHAMIITPSLERLTTPGFPNG